jgi:hypothetical protein
VRVIAATADASVIEVTGANGLQWTIMVNDGPASATQRHAVTAGGKTYEWTGNYAVEGLR